jgi:hypothetical protein
MLPGALLAGLSRTPLPGVPLDLARPAAAGGRHAWRLARRGRRLAAVALRGLRRGDWESSIPEEREVMPEVDRVASARPLWRRLSSQADHVCIEPIHRNWRYGLNYYSGVPLAGLPGRPTGPFTFSRRRATRPKSRLARV